MNEKPNTNVNLIATSIALKKLKKKKNKQISLRENFVCRLKMKGLS